MPANSNFHLHISYQEWVDSLLKKSLSVQGGFLYIRTKMPINRKGVTALTVIQFRRGGKGSYKSEQAINRYEIYDSVLFCLLSGIFIHADDICVYRMECHFVRIL